MSRRRNTNNRDGGSNAPNPGYDSPLEEDIDDDNVRQIETNDLAASILAYILRNRYLNVVLLA